MYINQNVSSLTRSNKLFRALSGYIGKGAICLNHLHISSADTTPNPQQHHALVCVFGGKFRQSLQ